jgi:hypothetical protein
VKQELEDAVPGTINVEFISVHPGVYTGSDSNQRLRQERVI